MDDREFEILSAMVREIYEQGRVPEPGSPEAEVVKKYDEFLKSKRSQLSGLLSDINGGQVPAGMNDIVKKEYVESVRKILEEGRTPEPGSYEAKILSNYDAILKGEQDQLANYLSENDKQITQEEPDLTLGSNKQKIDDPIRQYNEALEAIQTLENNHIPSLLARIKLGLANTKKKIDETTQREFRYRQFRRFKGYTFDDYVNEIFNRKRMKDQRRNIDRQTRIINGMTETPDNSEYIGRLREARDAAEKRLQSMRDTMRGQRGFAFIEEEDSKDISKSGKITGLRDPNYLKMIAGRGEGLGQFRTSYTNISVSQTRHAISATAWAGMFAIAYIAMFKSLNNVDPALFESIEKTGMSGLINQLIPIAREGINKLRSITTSNNIKDILDNAPAQVVLSAQALAITTIGMLRQAHLVLKDNRQRKLMEDQSYLNIGDDVDNIARHM